MVKQTQTKMFNFSDTDLDFCAGSKAKFPNVFKKMLSTGFNEKTVSSVTVEGNQVTFEYGVLHGYAVDRVLWVGSAGIQGEYVIHSITDTTVTITVENPPILSGGFTTKVAPLGYELVFESGSVHLYKFKDLDESDLYLRLVFAATNGYTRNFIAPCIGRTADIATGVITDEESYAANRSIVSPGNSLKWEFTSVAAATYNNYSYSQGESLFGQGVVVGSRYHLAVLSNLQSGGMTGIVNGFFPVTTTYNTLKLPVITGKVAAGNGETQGLSNSYSAYIGNISVAFDQNSSTSALIFNEKQAAASLLPTTIDNFNTTTARPISIYERSTRQHLGFVSGGVYVAQYGSTNTPSTTFGSNIVETIDIDFESKCYIQHMARVNGVDYAVFLVFPVEEIKYGN